MKAKDNLGHRITPITWWSVSNLLLSRGLVKMSAFWRSIGIYSRATIFLSTRSLKKWYLISMCLVLRVLNKVLKEIDSTRIITIDNHGVLWYPIITQKFFYSEKLWTATSSSNIFCFCNRQRNKILLFTHLSNKISPYIKTPTSGAFSIIGIASPIWIWESSKRQFDTLL